MRHDNANRPSKIQYYCDLASVVSSRASCCRRAVGCVLVDNSGHILATGYNGPPSGLPNCTLDQPCPGAKLPSGEGHEKCEAVHAEQNALLQCKVVEHIHGCFVTTSPCITCVKLLMNTPCQTIVFLEEHVTSAPAKELWQRMGRDWIQFNGSSNRQAH